ncbi:MAG: glycosyltransferase 87 family protein [Nocardioides sp.]|nr:glycosyltransferase 87 family protein [Nocardioides sp.]
MTEEFDRRAHPTLEDPVVTGLSEGIGGPLGNHARQNRWLTPTGLILALMAFCFALGMLQKAPCHDDNWLNGDERYSRMCYSDLPYLYVGRGFAELNWPYSGDEETRGRYEVMEYPVGISYFAYGSAWLTHWANGSPDIGDRPAVQVSDLYDDPEVYGEIGDYVTVSAVLLGIAALIAAWFLAGTHRNRPWDAALFAASPALILNGLVNWDLLAVAMVAGALWAWSRDRPVLTGVMIGLGTATKLYPLFLLGAILVIALRRREILRFFQVTVVAALVWAVTNAPAWLSGREQWDVFWKFNEERGADLGSVWMLFQQAGHAAGLGTINMVSWVFFIAWCAVVLVIGLAAPKTPRMAQLGFLIVAGFLLVNKVYSPQYVLWLLPLAVLARPRWKDQLIWQAGEIFYFASVWWYLGGFLAPTSGGEPAFYWLAIVVRIAAELYLVAVVTRDVLSPRHDPVGHEREQRPPDRGSAARSRAIAAE